MWQEKDLTEFDHKKIANDRRLGQICACGLLEFSRPWYEYICKEAAIYIPDFHKPREIVSDTKMNIT